MGVFQNNLMGAAAAAASAGGDFYSHQIANSVRFNSSATAHMYHTQGTPTNVDKCTISFWVKRSKLGAARYGMTGSGASGDYTFITFGGDGNDPDKFYYLQDPGSPTVVLESNAVFRDPTGWMHIVIAQDSTQGTDSNRNKIYINGVQLTDWGTGFTPSFYSTQNSDFLMNTSGHKLFVGSGGDSGGNAYLPFDGYIAEYVFIDGTQNDISDFGETKNGVWIPKDPSGLTFGNNGCYLKFESSSDLGNDSSGNNNDFTLSNISAHDQMLDSPTFNADSNGGNFATYNPLTAGSYISLSEGNLKTTGTTTGDEGCSLATMGVTSGKWYWEVRMISMRYSVPGPGISAGSASATQATTTGGPRNLLYYAGNSSNFLRDFDSTIWGTVTEVETGLAGFSAGDKMMIALDVDNKKVWYGKNGSWFNSGNPATGANPQQSWTGTGFSINPSIQEYDSSSSSSSCANFGQDGTFAGTETAQGNSDDTGYGNFFYDPPSAFLALCSGNLPTADAVDPAQTDDNYPQKLFQAFTWTGDGNTTRSFTLNFKPDFSWAKQRSHGYQHTLYDTNRGYATLKALGSDGTWAEGGGGDNSGNGYFSASDSSGFSVNRGTNTSAGTSLTNSSSTTYASWHWRANGGTTSSNATGDITSTVQVDPSGHFSIVKYTANGSANQTWAHGLSAKPDFIILKKYSATASWVTYHSSLGATKYMYLNSNASVYTGSEIWNNTEPTTSLVTVDNNGNSNDPSGASFIAYCFANCEGYIRTGSYIGNGSTDGAFVYTGLKPAWVMTKMTDGGAEWTIFDTKRDPHNLSERILQADLSDAERTDLDEIDILSNGFKCKYNGGRTNQSGKTYIYLAFASNPFQYATAR